MALGSGSEPRKQPTGVRPGLERLVFGSKAQAVTVFRMRGTAPRQAVIFLHGWGLKGPQAYRPWLEHLARSGSTVIVPRYQTTVGSRPDLALARAAAGIRTAMRRVAIRRDGLVLAGHSAGAALAVDLAATARRSGIPAPQGMLLMFPGRAIKDFPAGIPAQDASTIPERTKTIVMASTVDQVVGDEPARELHATLKANSVTDLELLEVSGDVLGEHFAPARSAPPMRRYFWRVLDGLIARARA